jgi:hypothetical protein
MMFSSTLLMAATILVGQAEEVKAMPVYSVHALELREGVATEEFEAFASGEFAKAFRKSDRGVRCIVMKGDRGALKGKYGLLVLFASKQVRDKYFPAEGKDPSPALRQDATPAQVKVVEKLATFVRSTGYTDFVSFGE